MPGKTGWMTGLVVVALAIAGNGAIASEKKEEKNKKERTVERGEKSDEKETGGKLAAFEKKVEKGSESKPAKKESHSYSCGCSSCEPGPGSLFLADMIWIGTYTLLVGSPDEFEQSRAFHEPFSRYPYRKPTDGLFAGGDGKPLAFDLGADFFYHDESLTGWEIHARFSPVSFLTLDGKYSRLTEEGLPGSRDLEFGTLLLNFNRIRTNRVVLFWGGGIRGMWGERTRTGFAFDVGMEVYPVRPVSLSATYVGSWFNGVYVPEFTGTVNLHIGRTAVFVGYQNWSAGGERLDGMVTGVKVYF